MTFMINATFPGSCQLRNAYVSVLSAAGSSAINGASRWLAARATDGVIARVMRAATDNATTCFKYFIFEFVMVDVPFLRRCDGAESAPGYFFLSVRSTTGETIGKLLDDGGGQGIRDHAHVCGSAANRHESLVHVAARLSIDHVLQRQHLIFHQPGNRLFWQIRVRRSEKRAEILCVLDEIIDGLAFLGVVFSCNPDGVVTDKADVFAPQRQKRVLGARAVHRANRFGNVYGITIARVLGRFEFAVTPSESRARRPSSEKHMFAKQRVEARPQIRAHHPRMIHLRRHRARA